MPPFKAEDLQQLFKKVLRNQYPAIPTHFSVDMRSLIDAILKSNPEVRPTCDEILNLPFVQKRIRKYFNEREGPELMQVNQSFNLMNEITILRNVYTSELPLPHFNFDIKKYNLNGWGRWRKVTKITVDGGDGEDDQYDESMKIVEINNVSETVENQINKIVVVNKHSRAGKKTKGGKGDEDDGSVQEDDAGLRAQRRANRKGAFAAGKKIDMKLGNDDGLL